MAAFEIEDGVLVSYAFAGGDARIPDGVTEIGPSAFEKAIFLKTVHIPASVERIGSHAFMRCFALEAVTGCEGVRVVSPDAFDKCESLLRTNMPVCLRDLLEQTRFNNSRKDAAYLHKWRHVHECFKSLSSNNTQADLEIGEWYTSIDEGALYWHDEIRSVTLPDRLEKMGCRAFSAMSGLQAITIPSGLARIPDNAFSSSGLVDVYILLGVQEIGPSAFSYCENLERVLIPGSVREIGQAAFSCCESLRSMDIPEGVELIGPEAFDGCSDLLELKLPASLKCIYPNAIDKYAEDLQVFLPAGCLEGKVTQDSTYSKDEFLALLDGTKYSRSISSHSN